MFVRPLAWFGVGIVVGASWGGWQGSLYAGTCVALTLGAGLGLMLGLPRRRAGTFSLPPLHAVAGALMIGLAGGAMVNPGTVFDPGWVLAGDDEVGRGPGFVLHTDAPNAETDRQLTGFLKAFRDQVATQLLGPMDDACSVEIHVLRKPASFTRAQRFGMNSPFGYYSPGTLRGPMVVVPEQSGLGSITHHLMYHLAACTHPEGLPRWAVTGLATFAEKVIGLELDGRWRISWGYRHPMRDQTIRAELSDVDLQDVLREGIDQSLLQGFFIYLHHRGWLQPLFRAMPSVGDGPALRQVTSMGPRALHADFLAWYQQDAVHIPLLSASFAASGTQAAAVLAQLNGRFVWVPERHAWRTPPDRRHSEEILAP